MSVDYVSFLKHEIFKVHEYHQFELLFESLTNIPVGPTDRTAILERAYIYGGRSIFAGLIRGPSPVVIDYRTQSAIARSNYQGSWLEHSGFEYPLASEAITDIAQGYDFSFSHLDTRMLLIPNVLHHCRDFSELMKGFLSRMPMLARVFVFDSYLREEHQTPDDFCRYTPSALASVMRRLGFTERSRQEIGNIFDAILYLVSQATWQLNNDARLSEVRELLEGRVVPALRNLRTEPDWRPLGRPYASMATAYAITFER